MEYNFESLRKQVEVSVDEHNRFQSVDAILYNGSIILAILATSAATLIPKEFITTTKVLAGIGAVLISLERALSWGKRWLYHRQMRPEYLIIDAKISFYENITSEFLPEEKKKYFIEIYNDLYNLRRKETEVPGTNESGATAKQGL